MLGLEITQLGRAGSMPISPLQYPEIPWGYKIPPSPYVLSMYLQLLENCQNAYMYLFVFPFLDFLDCQSFGLVLTVSDESSAWLTVGAGETLLRGIRDLHQPPVEGSQGSVFSPT